MKITIMQPYIFPYIGYFQLIKSVDTFVFYDDVNFIKRGWINRNKILINGKESLLSFPCIKASQNKKINEVGINMEDPQYNKILKSIYSTYKKAPYFETVYPIIEKCFDSKNKNIADFSIDSVRSVCNYLGFQTTFKVSSHEHPKTQHLDKADRLIEISKIEQIENYVNAIGGQEIYQKEYFRNKEIKLSFLKPHLTEYNQFKNTFVPGLSIIDVLMFNSIEEITKMLNQYELV